MTDLREALLKAGLVDPSTVQQVESEQRHRHRKGPRRPERPARAPAPDRPDDDAAAAALVERGRLPLARGPRRWYAHGREDRIRALDLSDALAARLEQGEAALAEAPDGTLACVDGDTGRELARVAPGWLRVWNGTR